MDVSAKAPRDQVGRLALGAVIGALFGAILGGLVFNALGTVSTATSLVRLTPPAELTAIATGAERTSPDTEDYITQYVAGEVAYLSGIGFTRAVGESLGQSEPAQIDVLQEIGSSVIVFSATADSETDAARIVQAAVDVYSAQVAERFDGPLESILPALDEWEASANTAGDLARVRQIQALRESIDLQAGTPASVTVLQPPAVEETSGSQWLLGAALGAVLGGAVVPLRQTARRRKAGYLRSAADIAGTVDAVLAPAVDLKPDVSGSGSPGALARTLFAQCTSPGPARTIVVIGASSASGTSVVAALFGEAAAETGPVTSIRLTDLTTSALRDDGETTVIVDAGAVGDSGLFGEAVRQATDLIVVVRLGVDTVQHLHIVRSATAASEVPLAAVMTYLAARGISHSATTTTGTSTR